MRAHSDFDEAIASITTGVAEPEAVHNAHESNTSEIAGCAPERRRTRSDYGCRHAYFRTDLCDGPTWAGRSLGCLTEGVSVLGCKTSRRRHELDGKPQVAAF